MIYLKQLLLIFLGLSAGAVVAAGLFAFVVTIGVVTRIVGKSHTAKNSRLYEDCIAVGATVGNAYCFYQWSLPGGSLLMTIFGGCAGIYVGCLVMSLAETVNALPVMSRRLRLAVGLQYLILSVAIGKAVGALLYVVLGVAEAAG